MLSLPADQMVAGDPCHLCGHGVDWTAGAVWCPVCGWSEAVR